MIYEIYFFIKFKNLTLESKSANFGFYTEGSVFYKFMNLLLSVFRNNI